MNSLIVILCEFLEKIQIEALFAITATILALLIPLAIFMIEENGSTKDGSVLWDKMVIFTQVINIKLTIVGLIFITIPLIFWNYNGARLLIVVLFLLGLFFMAILLNNCYKWIIVKRTNDGDYRNEMRFKYLNKLKNASEITDTWKLIWESEKNRVGINENLLLDKFFEKWRSYNNNEDKIKMLSIFTPNMNVNHESIEKIENHIYHEMEKFSNNNRAEIEYKFLLKQMYLKYAEQSIGNPILKYQFAERLDRFIENEESEVIDRFLNQVGIEIINIFKKNFLEENTLEEFFPKNLNYENFTEDKNKKNIISNLFVNWLIRSKILDDYSDNNDGIFANELLIVMFNKMSPFSFTRLANYANFLQKNKVNWDIEELEKGQLIMYSLKRRNFIGRGRAFNIDSDVEYKIIQKEEREWTYKYILESNNLLFEELKNEKTIERKIDMIEQILSFDQHLEEISKATLEGLIYELKEFLEYGKRENIISS